MQYKGMKKRTVFGVLLATGIIAFPLWAGGISAPPALNQVVADTLYVNEAGDTGMTGSHDYTLATLLAKAATADTHVVNRLFGDGRYFPFSGGTITGNFLVDGDVILGDATLDTVTSNATNWVFPSNTEFDNAGKFIQLTGGLKVNQPVTFFSNFTVEGSTTLGDVVGDQVESHAGGWFFRSATDMQFDAALILDATGFPVTCNGSSWTFAADVKLYGDTWIGFLGTDAVEVNAGIWMYQNDLVADYDGETVLNFNELITFDATGQSPEMKGDTWDFATHVTNVTVPDANAATEAANIQTGDARWRSPIVVMFSGATSPYFSTTSGAYTQAGVFYFGGTDLWGTPTAIKVIGFKDANPTSWDVQLLDITNATTIATKAGNTGTASEIVDMGTLSNLPPGEAMFELQIQRTGGVGFSVYANSLVLQF